MDPNNADDFARLAAARENSFQQLATNRSNRLYAIKEYCGGNYGDGGTEHAVPMPLLTMAVQIWARYIVGKDPRVMLSTHYPQLRTTATHFEYSINQRIAIMELQETIREAVMGAFFGVGILKGSIDKQEGYKARQPYIDSIDLDDWFHDTQAERWKDTQYRGHRFQMPLEEARSNEKWDAEAREALQKITFDSEERAGDASRGARQDDRPVDMVDLWETYLPATQTMIIDGGHDAARPLKTWKFKGPRSGPYYFLGFGDVPRNIMPLASVAMLSELHRMANNMYRKMEDQADAQRNILAGPMNAREDGEKILHSKDGDYIPVMSPELLKGYSLGGVDARTFNYGMHLVDRFFMTAGNLDMLGGLSPSAGTLGQERILNERAGMLIQDISERVLRAVQWCARTIGHYIWKDPVTAHVFERQIPGVPGLTVPVRFGPEHRKGDLLSYEIKIEPYALSYRSPGERAQALMAMLGQLQPLYPEMMRQGKSFDMGMLIDKLARMYDMPELSEVIVSTEPVATGANEPAPAPANTTRTHQRVNTAAPSRTGQEANMAGAMAQAQNAGALAAAG